VVVGVAAVAAIAMTMSKKGGPAARRAPAHHAEHHAAHHRA